MSLKHVTGNVERIRERGGKREREGQRRRKKESINYPEGNIANEVRNTKVDMPEKKSR